MMKLWNALGVSLVMAGCSAQALPPVTAEVSFQEESPEAPPPQTLNVELQKMDVEITELKNKVNEITAQIRTYDNQTTLDGTPGTAFQRGCSNKFAEDKSMRAKEQEIRSQHPFTASHCQDAVFQDNGDNFMACQRYARNFEIETLKELVRLRSEILNCIEAEFPKK